MMFWKPWVGYCNVKIAGSLDRSYFKHIYELMPPYRKKAGGRVGWQFFGLSDASILYHISVEMPEEKKTGYDWITEVLWFTTHPIFQGKEVDPEKELIEQERPIGFAPFD